MTLSVVLVLSRTKYNYKVRNYRLSPVDVNLRLLQIFSDAKSLLVALVGSDALVGEPLAHLLGRDVGLLGEHIGHALVRIRVALVLVEPLVQDVHHAVRKEAVDGPRASQLGLAHRRIVLVRQRRVEVLGRVLAPVVVVRVLADDGLAAASLAAAAGGRALVRHAWPVRVERVGRRGQRVRGARR